MSSPVAAPGTPAEQAAQPVASPADVLSSFDMDNAFGGDVEPAAAPPAPVGEPSPASPASPAVESDRTDDAPPAAADEPAKPPEEARADPAPKPEDVAAQAVSRRREAEQERQRQLADLTTERDTVAARATTLETELSQAQQRIAQLEAQTSGTDEALVAVRQRYQSDLLPDAEWDRLSSLARREASENVSLLSDDERSALLKAEPLRAHLRAMHADAATFAETTLTQREQRFQANVGKQLSALAALPGVDGTKVTTPESIEAAGRHLYDAGAASREAEVSDLKEKLADLEAANEALEARVAVGGLAPELGGRSPTASAATRSAWDHTAPAERQFEDAFGSVN